jgi:hypothetical protein
MTKRNRGRKAGRKMVKGDSSGIPKSSGITHFLPLCLVVIFSVFDLMDSQSKKILSFTD